MDEKRLTVIETRATVASPGTWSLCINDEGNLVFAGVSETGDTGVFWITSADADFIAHARDDVPALVEAVRTAWRERDEAWAALKGLVDAYADGKTNRLGMAWTAARKVLGEEKP